jgi:hypothetical protein
MVITHRQVKIKITYGGWCKDGEENGFKEDFKGKKWLNKKQKKS